MKHLSIVALIAVATLATSPLSAADGIFNKRLKGNGNKIIENRKSAMLFSEVEVRNNIHLVISDRTDGDILVRTDENIMPLVRMEVRNGVFRAWLDSSSFRSTVSVRIDIEMPYNGRICEIDAVAASSVTVVPQLTASEVELSASGASRIVANIQCQSLDVELTGASSAQLSVKADELELSTLGASSAKLHSATLRSCDLDASGASKIVGHILTEECDCEASGASKLSLDGSARRAEFELSGASKLSATNLTTDICTIEASGASAAYIHCRGTLSAETSGSSKVGYSGECLVNHPSSSVFKQK